MGEISEYSENYIQDNQGDEKAHQTMSILTKPKAAELNQQLMAIRKQNMLYQQRQLELINNQNQN